MAKPSILVVEDDKNISKLLKYNLEKEGFNCFTAITAEDGFAILGSEPVDLIILDIMLPTIDGLTACRRIKNDDDFGSLPIILLTAKGEEIDRVLGFELGADDYVVKPFSPRELILRIKAILRRDREKGKKGKGVISCHDIVVDQARHTVRARKKIVELTSMEFKLLVMLMERRGRVQSRDQLLEEVWGFSSEVTTRTVDTHIKRLRQKLGACGKFIETVRGVGYKIKDE
jgi:two-component system, OmpR family, phosphate regulon response regulator PhoB